MKTIQRFGLTKWEITVVTLCGIIILLLLFECIYPYNQRYADWKKYRAGGLSLADSFPVEKLRGIPVTAAQLEGEWKNNASRCSICISIKPVNDWALRLKVISSNDCSNTSCELTRIGALNGEQGIIMLDKPALDAFDSGFQFITVNKHTDGKQVLQIPQIKKINGKLSDQLNESPVFNTLYRNNGVSVKK